MIWHGNRWSRSSRKDIILAVILFVENFRSHQRSHLSVIINHLELLTIVISVISERDNIECGSSLVFLAGLVDVSSHSDSVLLEFLVGVHCVEPGIFPLESFISQIIDF